MQSVLRVVVFSGITVTVLAAAEAQTITRQGSGVIARFASQSEVFSAADPFPNPWPLSAGIGLYPLSAVVPSLPLPPTPAIVPATGNPFAGGGYTSGFNDLLGTTTFTASAVTIDDLVAAVPVTTADVQIQFQNWRLQQAPAAPGYAYCQLNFGSNYFVTSNPGLAAASNPAVPLLVTGQTLGLSSYAQFAASIDYTWIPATVTADGGVTQTGPMLSLGTLSYGWQVTGPGPFSLPLNSVGSLAAVPAVDGILSLTGFAWVAGDPVDVTVTAVPEPATAAGVVVAGVISLCRRRRGRSCAA